MPRRFTHWATSGLLLFALAACETATPVEESGYQYRSPSRDGIGKIYQGREISHVMGHQGASWLERPDREREERTDLLVAALPIEPDSVIADIGAGTGYFSFRMAQRAPRGQVFAVDIQPEMLEIVRERAAAGEIGNVIAHQGTERSADLPAGSVDLVLLVDAYHEFSWPKEMGDSLVEALRPGGILALVEYRAEDPTVPIKRLHKMSEKQARKEMEAIGLQWLRTDDLLPQQHLMLFQRPLGKP